MSKKTLTWVLIALAVVLSVGYLIRADATPAPKVTICHATESEENPWTRNVVSENAIGGHFDNPGTPKAGHEDDILLQGDVECPEVEDEEPCETRAFLTTYGECEEEPEEPEEPKEPTDPEEPVDEPEVQSATDEVPVQGK